MASSYTEVLVYIWPVTNFVPHTSFVCLTEEEEEEEEEEVFVIVYIASLAGLERSYKNALVEDHTWSRNQSFCPK